MGKYHFPPQKTGQEYVDAADELCAVTEFRCERLPKRWENSLNEIIKIAKKIRRKVRQANSIRISTKVSFPFSASPVKASRRTARRGTATRFTPSLAACMATNRSLA